MQSVHEDEELVDDCRGLSTTAHLQEGLNRPYAASSPVVVGQRVYPVADSQQMGLILPPTFHHNGTSPVSQHQTSSFNAYPAPYPAQYAAPPQYLRHGHGHPGACLTPRLSALNCGHQGAGPPHHHHQQQDPYGEYNSQQFSDYRSQYHSGSKTRSYRDSFHTDAETECSSVNDFQNRSLEHCSYDSGSSSFEHATHYTVSEEEPAPAVGCMNTLFFHATKETFENKSDDNESVGLKLGKTKVVLATEYVDRLVPNQPCLVPNLVPILGPNQSCKGPMLPFNNKKCGFACDPAGYVQYEEDVVQVDPYQQFRERLVYESLFEEEEESDGSDGGEEVNNVGEERQDLFDTFGNQKPAFGLDGGNRPNFGLQQEQPRIEAPPSQIYLAEQDDASAFTSPFSERGAGPSTHSRKSYVDQHQDPAKLIGPTVPAMGGAAKMRPQVTQRQISPDHQDPVSRTDPTIPAKKVAVEVATAKHQEGPDPRVHDSPDRPARVSPIEPTKPSIAGGISMKHEQDNSIQFRNEVEKKNPFHQHHQQQPQQPQQQKNDSSKPKQNAAQLTVSTKPVQKKVLASIDEFPSFDEPTVAKESIKRAASKVPLNTLPLIPEKKDEVSKEGEGPTATMIEHYARRISIHQRAAVIFPSKKKDAKKEDQSFRSMRKLDDEDMMLSAKLRNTRIQEKPVSPEGPCDEGVIASNRKVLPFLSIDGPEEDEILRQRKNLFPRKHLKEIDSVLSPSRSSSPSTLGGSLVHPSDYSAETIPKGNLTTSYHFDSVSIAGTQSFVTCIGGDDFSLHRGLVGSPYRAATIEFEDSVLKESGTKLNIRSPVRSSAAHGGGKIRLETSTEINPKRYLGSNSHYFGDDGGIPSLDDELEFESCDEWDQSGGPQLRIRLV